MNPKFKKGQIVRVDNTQGHLHDTATEEVKFSVGKEFTIIKIEDFGSGCYEYLLAIPDFQDWWFHERNLSECVKGIDIKSIISKVYKI